MSTNTTKGTRHGVIAAEAAVPTSKKPYETDPEKSTCTHEHATTMKASPLWPTATALHPITDAWMATADALDAKNADIADLLSQVSKAQSDRNVLRSAWLAGRRQMLGAIAGVAKGSGAVIQQLGYDVKQAPVTAEITIVSGLSAASGANTGEVNVEWDDTVNRYGFILQHATNPDDRATLSATIPCVSGSFILTGQVSGATIYFRVAAVDPTLDGHMTEWCAWAAGCAR